MGIGLRAISYYIFGAELSNRYFQSEKIWIYLPNKMCRDTCSDTPGKILAIIRKAVDPITGISADNLH